MAQTEEDAWLESQRQNALLPLPKQEDTSKAGPGSGSTPATAASTAYRIDFVSLEVIVPPFVLEEFRNATARFGVQLTFYDEVRTRDKEWKGEGPAQERGAG